MSAMDISNWVTGTWWPFVQSASLASFLVFALVAVVWWIIRRRASAHLGYALFLLPLVPFVIPLQGLFPLAVSSETPLARWLPVSAEQGTELSGATLRRETPIPSVQTAMRTSGPTAHSTQGMQQHTTATLPVRRSRWLSLPMALFAIWLAVVLTLASRWTVAHYRTHRMARQATPLRDPRLKLLVRKAAHQVTLPCQLRFAETKAVQAPAVCGIWRPTLLLPIGLADDLDDASITWAVHHELAHVRRFDLSVDSLQRALRILWWFHPTLWLLNRVVNELRECACDEAALARMPKFTRQRAARALVDAIDSARTPATGLLLVESLFSERTRLEKRIMRLIDPRRSRQLGLTPAALVALTLTAGVGLASTQLVASPAQANVAPLQEPEVRINAAFDAVLEEEIIEEGPELSVALALDWLVGQQHEDGHWDTGSARSGMAGEFNDVGVTALAIQCLQNSTNPKHEQTAKRGLAWLASIQDPDLGLFGEQEGYGYVAGHALATQTWIRAHGQSPEGEALEVANRALAFCYAAQNPYAGWRFEYPPIGDNDSFITSLMLRALATARSAGIEIEDSSIESASALLVQLTDKDNGRVGYTQLGEPAPRFVAKKEDFPAKYSEYPTAISLLAAIELEPDRIHDKILLRGSQLIANLPPTWDPAKGTNDGYYWMFGAQAMRQFGGAAWEAWRSALSNALVSSQQADGSWPLMDAWSGDDDYVHITCVYTLALQETLGE